LVAPSGVGGSVFTTVGSIVAGGGEGALVAPSFVGDCVPSSIGGLLEVPPGEGALLEVGVIVGRLVRSVGDGA